MSIVGTNPDAVVGGVDTHADVHVAAVMVRASHGDDKFSSGVSLSKIPESFSNLT